MSQAAGEPHSWAPLDRTSPQGAVPSLCTCVSAPALASGLVCAADRPLPASITATFSTL